MDIRISVVPWHQFLGRRFRISLCDLCCGYPLTKWRTFGSVGPEPLVIHICACKQLWRKRSWYWIRFLKLTLTQPTRFGISVWNLLTLHTVAFLSSFHPKKYTETGVLRSIWPKTSGFPCFFLLNILVATEQWTAAAPPHWQTWGHSDSTASAKGGTIGFSHSGWGQRSVMVWWVNHARVQSQKANSSFHSLCVFFEIPPLKCLCLLLCFVSHFKVFL